MRPSKCKDLLRFYGPVQKTLRNLNSLSPLTWPFTCLYLSLTKPGLFSLPLNSFVKKQDKTRLRNFGGKYACHFSRVPTIFYFTLWSGMPNMLFKRQSPDFRGWALLSKKMRKKEWCPKFDRTLQGGQTFLKHGLIFKYQPQGWEIIPYLCKVWMNNAKTFGLLGRGRFPKWLFTITKWLLCASHVGKWNCVNSGLKGEDKTNGIRNLVVAV